MTRVGMVFTLGAALVVSGWLAAGLSGCFAAQDEGDVLPVPKTTTEAFWEVRHQAEVAAAAQVVIEPNPLTRAILRMAYKRELVWIEPEFVLETAPRLNPDWLDDVKDGTPMPKVEGKLPDELRPDQLAIYRLYEEALIHSFHTPPDAFKASAAANSHVTFGHLWNNPGLYRGEVIPIEGRLMRLRKHPATSRAQQEGVKFVYEGWIAGPTQKSRPFWVMCTYLPDGLEVAEKMDRHVTFYGYFLKKMKYPSADQKGVLETPFLVGPTLILTPSASTNAGGATGPTYPLSMFAAGAAIVGGVSATLIFLSWWFRRGDRVLQGKLTAMQLERARQMVEDVSSEGPLAQGPSDRPLVEETNAVGKADDSVRFSVESPQKNSQNS